MSVGMCPISVALHCRILTIDMLATIVTANGKALTVSESENVDLFWGIRGGGNSHKKYDLNVIPVGKLLISARTIFLSSAIQALHLQPADKAVVYNIAMIQQKSAELLFLLQPGKCMLTDLERSIAQKMFGSLAADPASTVPYD